MDNKKIQHYFLLALLFGSIIITFFIVRPFIYAIILALVVAVIFHSAHQKMLLLARNNKGLAAFLTTVAIIFMILVPFVLLGMKVFQEVQDFYLFIVTGAGKDIFRDVSSNFINNFQHNIPFGKEFSIDADQTIKQGSLWVLNHVGQIFGSIAKLLFGFFIFIMVTYYLLKDGEKFKANIMRLSPLKDDDNKLISEKIKLAIDSAIKGNFIVAFVQGALAAVGFILFGVPSPILWGTAVILASFVPILGTAIIIVPAVIYVFFTQNILSAVGLLIWGTVMVGLIDNLLKPMFISRGMKIHPLIIFLSVLGGIAFWGPIGLLLGPLTISLLFTFSEIYFSLQNANSKID